MLRWAFIPIETIKENSVRCCSQLIPRLRNRGEGWVSCLREVEIVKAHERDVFGAPESCFANGKQGPEGDQVIPSKNSCRTRNKAEQHERLRVPARFVKRGFLNIL